MKDFNNLKIWQQEVNLLLDVNNASRRNNSKVLFELTDQMRRSAILMPSNIAEGSGRNSDKGFSRFPDIAIGSSFELETQIIIAQKLNFITDQDLADLSEKFTEEQKVITGL